MNHETPDDVEISYSTMRMLRLLTMGVGMSALCAAAALNWFGWHTNRFEVVMGYCGLVFFALATCRIAWTWMASRGPVLFLSRQGVRDLRVADTLILWSSVTGISTWTFGRQKSVVLAITPELEQHLFAGPGKQAAMHFANKAVGVNGIPITAAGLDIGIDELLRMCQEYYFAAKSASTPRPRTGGAAHPMKRTACVA